MKIGKFANVNNLSIDAIRHYMDIGLIVPEKQGGQYSFDSRCQKDLEEILELKSIGFTLNEIKTIFLFKRLGELTPYQEEDYYKSLFINKHENVEREIRELSEAKERLQSKIESLSKVESKENFQIGIDFNALNLFRCVKCGGDLILTEGSINNNQIINGKLSCSCGEEYIIDSGILKVKNPYMVPDYDSDHGHITRYINGTDIKYLDSLYKGLEWWHKKINTDQLQNKVLLEVGSGLGFFMRTIYNKLPDNCIYIAVDHSFERHKILRSILQRAEARKNIIFVCSDFLEIPIKEKSVDILFDISGTSNYSFVHEEFLLEGVNHYLKDNSYLFGSYILFKNFGFNSLIESRCRKNFMEKTIKEKLRQLSFKLIEEQTSDYIEKGGEFENFFVSGEKVYNYYFYGKR